MFKGRRDRKGCYVFKGRRDSKGCCVFKARRGVIRKGALVTQGGVCADELGIKKSREPPGVYYANLIEIE